MIRILQIAFFAICVFGFIKLYYIFNTTSDTINKVNNLKNRVNILAVDQSSSNSTNENKEYEYKEYTNYDNALAIAKKENRQLLMIFTTTWCGPCVSMKATTLKNKNVKNAMKKYVIVKIDPDKEAVPFYKYGGTSIPYYVIADNKENIIRKDTGYRQKNDFIEWLEK